MKIELMVNVFVIPCLPVIFSNFDDLTLDHLGNELINFLIDQKIC